MVDIPVLVCTDGMRAGESFEVTERGLDIGRADGNDIVLQDEDVSRFHARLQYDNGSLWLRDLGSRNGVFVNDSRLTGHKDLRVGDTVRVGASSFEVRWSSDKQAKQGATKGDKPRKSWFGLFEK